MENYRDTGHSSIDREVGTRNSGSANVKEIVSDRIRSLTKLEKKTH